MEGSQVKQQCEATILAIGTANPSNCVYQDDYADYYFRVTNSQDKTLLKDQFKRICEKSMIKKRYMQVDEQMLKDNPSFCAYAASSLDARQDIKIEAIPRLAERAAAAAIEEWGRPRSAITHLVFHSSSGADMPGADCRLVESLGLARSVRRLLLYHLGCYAGGTVLRLAKDLAENNPGARVLAVCAEITTVPTFRGPNEHDRACLVGQAIFGDGAAALIIGSGDLSAETPLFRVVSAAQTLIPSSSGAIAGHVREAGVTFYLSPEVPKLIGDSIEACLAEAMAPLGIGPGGGWNAVFWAPHPGGAAILREVEERAGLEEGKLRAAWRVLSEYGNMSSGTVFFVLDEMRKRSAAEGRSTTGEGLEWGVRFGFGPGVTVETVVLRSVPIAPN